MGYHRTPGLRRSSGQILITTKGQESQNRREGLGNRQKSRLFQAEPDTEREDQLIMRSKFQESAIP